MLVIKLVSLKSLESYHYQFYKVFGTDDKLAEAKKLWAESLKKYPSECIDSAVEIVIQSNDYLPTLTEIIKACSGSMGSINIPNPQEAFIEAQKSSSPRCVALSAYARSSTSVII